MAEETLKNYVLKGMRPFWGGGVKHADAFTPGIADVSGRLLPAGNVFIELKALDRWPKRPGTTVTFGLDAAQKDFLWARCGWLLCRVKREYFLFDHKTVPFIDTHGATQGWLRGNAEKIWIGSINWKEFAQCVGRRYG